MRRDEDNLSVLGSGLLARAGRTGLEDQGGSLRARRADMRTRDGEKPTIVGLDECRLQPHGLVIRRHRARMT